MMMIDLVCEIATPVSQQSDKITENYLVDFMGMIVLLTIYKLRGQMYVDASPWHPYMSFPQTIPTTLEATVYNVLMLQHIKISLYLGFYWAFNLFMDVGM